MEAPAGLVNTVELIRDFKLSDLQTQIQARLLVLPQLLERPMEVTLGRNKQVALPTCCRASPLAIRIMERLLAFTRKSSGPRTPARRGSFKQIGCQTQIISELFPSETQLRERWSV